MLTAAEMIAEAFEAFASELRKIGRATGYYSSADLPPGYKSRVSFNEACRTGRIPGAHKRGHIWVVSHDDYHRKDEMPRLRKPRNGRPSPDPKQRALASLRAKGLAPRENA